MGGSLATAAFFVFLLCLFFAPRWETNDDIAMSMVAHGYGIAANGSPPNLMFSNVLWGYIVRAIPEIRGVLGYSIATLSALVMVGSVVIYGLFRLGVGYVACLSVLALILVRPVLFPQFTINAGLLMVAAIICWHLYVQQNDRRALVGGCLLAFLSYLVRSQEFVLVLIVALPMLPWRALLVSRFSKITFLALISAIAVSAAVDYQAYQGRDWKAFNELNPARAAFTDFRVGEHLEKRWDILERHGYSINDIKLIKNWFFVDSHIANPKALRSMVGELELLPNYRDALMNAWIGVQTLWHPVLLTSVMTALLLALFRPSWQVTASWGLCIIAVFALGLLGRPGVLRVYVPLICLLLIAPLLSTQVSGWRKQLSVGVLFVAAIINATYVFTESKISQIDNEAVGKAFATFPNYPIVVWGGGLPFESIYPVLGSSTAAMHYQLYGLGVSTLAPFSIAFAEHQAGHGMIERLMSQKGVPVIAAEFLLKSLDVYCTEHHHGNLRWLSTQEYGPVVVNWLRCEL